MSLKAKLLHTSSFFVIAIPLVMFLGLLIPFRVDGISMEPTYHNLAINYCWRGAYLFSDPKRYDVVVVRLSGMNKFLLKRIIGLPGEKIEFRNGMAFINDKKIEEPYIKLPWDWTMPPVVIKSTNIFIVGDNRNVKIFQHSFGEVPIGMILGKVL